MKVEYWCRYCHHVVGQIDRPEWTRADAEHFLGLNLLSPVERSQSVAYYGKHGVLTVQTVCDFCQSAIERNPEVLVEGKLLQ